MSQVVLVPGLLCDEWLWQAQSEALKAAGHEVQISTATLQAGSIEAMASGVLAQAPPRFALAGLSMGGYVAMAVLRLAPERVERLALLNTTARADQPQQTEFRQTLITQTEQGEFEAAVDTLLPVLVGAEAAARQPDLPDAVRQMAMRVGAEAFVRQQQAIITRVDARAELGRIACPSLVICGQQDRLTPPDLAQEITACIPAAHLRLLSDCGHLSTLEQADGVNRALLEWLAL